MDAITSWIDRWPQWVQILATVGGALLSLTVVIVAMGKGSFRKVFPSDAKRVSETVHGLPSDMQVHRKRRAYEQVLKAVHRYNQLLHEMGFMDSRNRAHTQDLADRIQGAIELDRQTEDAKSTIEVELDGAQVIRLYNLLANDLQGMYHGHVLLFHGEDEEKTRNGQELMRRRLAENFETLRTLIRRLVQELE